MECVELSDLEEGEILEYESDSPNDFRCDDYEVRNCSLSTLRKEYRSYDFQFKRNNEGDTYICERGRDGYNLKHNQKVKEMKSHLNMIDLKSISSEEEHKSDEENKYCGGINKYKIYSENRNKRKKQLNQFYGTVEDIMSEIGETICRKSRCKYKKSLSKESQCNLNRYSDKSYNLWSRKIFSSHLKNKKRRRNTSVNDSDTDSAKDRGDRRRRRKNNKDIYYKEDKKPIKNSQVRDFDEMRRTLLEKLQKQKAEEEVKASTNECTPEMQSSEIQEVDMLIDCTNYVDNPRDGVPEDSPEDEKEDELDLIKLRLIALASNKKQKFRENTSEKPKEPSGEINSLENSNEVVDLDRNELLLRAEALKTALLKKHEKRLNRLKVKKASVAKEENTIEAREDLNSLPPVECNANSDMDACKENIEENESREGILSAEANINEANETSIEPNGSARKTHPKPRTKRKKRKSGSLPYHAIDNTEKSEALEEDDRTLRSQLLNDLMKKKALKDVGKKSVQALSTNFSPCTTNVQTLEENRKPLTVVKRSALKKMNPPKVKPSVVRAKIPKAEIQRIIVHLGSEDSSEEDDGSGQGPSGVGAEENQNGEKEIKEGAIAKLNHPNKAIHRDYEKSVELLLSQARKKIEGKKRIAEQNALGTPEAVYRHLPPSQRLEYIRLKQKIAERERLRKEKTNNSGSLPALKTSTKKISQDSKADTKPMASNKVVNKSLSKPVVALHSPSSNRVIGGLTNSVKAKNTGQRKMLNITKTNLEGVRSNQFPVGKEFPVQRNKLLLPCSQALLSKLKLLLKKIKIEKIIEENYEREIAKLKNQLSLLEKKKNEQRFKIKKLGEESMKTYKAIQGITAKSNDETLPEKKIDGDAEKKLEETEGNKVSNKPEMELSKAQKTDKSPTKESTSEVAGETSVGGALLEYQSPLLVFNKASVCSERVDPNVMMCQFDLTGVCKDEDCTYQHLRTS